MSEENPIQEKKGIVNRPHKDSGKDPSVHIQHGKSYPTVEDAIEGIKLDRKKTQEIADELNKKHPDRPFYPSPDDNTWVERKGQAAHLPNATRIKPRP